MNNNNTLATNRAFIMNYYRGPPRARKYMEYIIIFSKKNCESANVKAQVYSIRKRLVCDKIEEKCFETLLCFLYCEVCIILS